MMRRFLTLAGVALLAGCAYPNPAHVAQLNTMIGRQEAELIRAYGVPLRSTDAGGSKFEEYAKHRIESFPSGPYGWGPGPWGWGGWGGWGYGGWSYGGADIEQFDCNTTFELRNGVVKGWTVRGNAC